MYDVLELLDQLYPFYASPVSEINTQEMQAVRLVVRCHLLFVAECATVALTP